MRNLLIIANWKLNGNKKIIEDYIKILRHKLMNINFPEKDCDVVIAPPIMYLDQAHQALIDTYIDLGAQNVDINLEGPFTGDISANMLKDFGIKYVIIGHSERRLYHQENDELIAKKFAIVKKVGLIPVFCIGENQLENKKGKTQEVCIRQMKTILDTQGVDALKDTVIAYEPIWAIGTDNYLSPLHTQSIHKFIRDYIATKNIDIAKKIILQYGGSVNSNNVYKFLMQPDIDGVLIGKASLNVSNFYNIIKYAIKAKEASDPTYCSS
ncbi:MAG: triose-phosphate isomerase [Candidatus Dasytiphilus stammeri]